MPGKMDRTKVVVVLEDNQETRSQLTEVLQDRGFYVVPVENAGRALEVLEQVRARLLIMDLMLPDMSGNELIRSLRANEITEGVPVMVLSNHLHLMGDGAGFDNGRTASFESPNYDSNSLDDVVAEVERLIGKPGVEEFALWP